MLEEVGKQPVGVIAANGTKDHVNRWIAKGLQEVGGARLGVRAQILHSPKSVRCKAHVKAIRAEAFDSQLHLVADEGLAGYTAREAYDANGLYHRSPVRSRIT